jgi:hypothetical protein
MDFWHSRRPFIKELGMTSWWDEARQEVVLVHYLTKRARILSLPEIEEDFDGHISAFAQSVAEPKRRRTDRQLLYNILAAIIEWASEED